MTTKLISNQWLITAIVKTISILNDIIIPLITTKNTGKLPTSGFLKNKYLLKYFNMNFWVSITYLKKESPLGICDIGHISE